MSDIRNESRPAWVCYDAGCDFCIRCAGRFRRRLERAGFALVPLQSPEVRRSLNLPEKELLAEMRVLTRDGKVLGGADAILHLGKNSRWAWPLWALAHLPGVRPLLRRAYRLLAANRYRLSGMWRKRAGVSKHQRHPTELS